MIYLDSHDAGRWLTNLRDRKSMVFVGERGSGRSTLVEHLLQSESGNAIRKGDALRINARQTSSGGDFMYTLAARCVRCYFDSPPDVLQRALRDLRKRAMADDMVDVLKPICADFEPPLIVIDHLESLADQLDTGHWATLRYLVEEHYLQLIGLSRLSIAEIEKLADSKMGPTIQPFQGDSIA